MENGNTKVWVNNRHIQQSECYQTRFPYILVGPTVCDYVSTISFLFVSGQMLVFRRLAEFTRVPRRALTAYVGRFYLDRKPSSAGITHTSLQTAGRTEY